MARKKYTSGDQKKAAPLTNEQRVQEVVGVHNSFSDALGFSPNQQFGVQLSQVDTLFKNNRWYLVSNYRQLLCEIYVEHGLIQTIVDVPVDDGLRGGVEIKTKQATPEQVEQVQAKMDREGDLLTIGQANKWNRLFGGAGVLILTGQDPRAQLDIEALGPGRPLGFRAVDMWELFFDLQNTDGYNPAIQEQGFEFYSYYGDTIHKSRVMRMKGLTAPSFIRPRLRGWGFSIVESFVRSINQYLKATDLTFEVLDEFKLDIFKIKNLTSALTSSVGLEKIRRRVQLANMEKNFNNAMTMDSEDDYIQKQLSFAGIAEVMEGIRNQIACDLRIPQTKLFGQSAAGFNSGEDDIENYNSMIESQVRTKIKYEILQMIELRFQNEFGFIPTDLSIEFKPLRMLKATEEEEVKTSVFNRIQTAKSSGELTTLEYRQAINTEQLLPIQLETDSATLSDVEDQAAALAGQGEDGANADNKETIPKTEKDDADPAGEEDLDPNTPNEPNSSHPAKKKNALDDAALLNFAGPKIVTVGLISGDELLTGKRRDNGLWTSPGGHMDEGETPEQAACREVFEESGIIIQPGDLKALKAEKCTSHRNGKEFVVFPFVANIDKARTTTKNDPDNEISVWKWVKIGSDTPELKGPARHAFKDAIVDHLLKTSVKNSFDFLSDYMSLPFEIGTYCELSPEIQNEYEKKAKNSIQNPGKVDEALWSKAKDASQKAFGREKWGFIEWWYQQHGGTHS